MSQKTINIILISLLVVVLIIGIIALVKSQKSNTVVPVINPTNPNQNGIGGAFADILGQVFTAGWLKNLFGGGKQCDPNNLGFTKNGVRDPKCGTPDNFKCDPNKPGYNLSGFPDIECGFGG